MSTRKNRSYKSGDGSPKYYVDIDLDQLAPGRKATLPVYVKPNRTHPVLKEIYHTEVGGFTIEKGNLPSLLNAIQETALTLVEKDSLPYYSVVLPDGTRVPIFLQKDTLRARIGGKKLSADHIGEMFGKLKYELITEGIIRRSGSLKLEIFLWRDLKLYPPAFVFRDVNDRIWIPIFCHTSDQGVHLNYDVINKPPMMFSIDDFGMLKRQVISDLKRRGTIYSGDSIYIDQMDDRVWNMIRSSMEKTGEALVYNDGEDSEIPIFEFDDELLAAKRPMVFFGNGPAKLKSVAADGLKQKGLIRSSISLRVERRKTE